MPDHAGVFLTPPLAKYDPFPMVIELKQPLAPLQSISSVNAGAQYVIYNPFSYTLRGLNYAPFYNLKIDLQPCHYYAM